jgi:hypothetical protein
MTRVLSELLGAKQPGFGMTIRQLEAATGKPSTDIRLTSEISQRAQQKLRTLHLDPHDTTGKELYQALLGRFHNDEKLARDTLGISSEVEPIEVHNAAIKFVQSHIGKRSAFAIKNSVAKKLLKTVPPKKAMKQLGYRSLDSMLKHESVPHLYVAAFLCETLSWRKKILEQYSSLQPRDFELRAVDISVPQSKRWETVSGHVARQQYPVLVFKELGSVVVLAQHNRSVSVLTDILLIASALNDIQSASSFLKLQQMKPDFGSFVQAVAEHEPLTQAKLMGRTVPWRVVHQYYARFAHAYNPLIFEPHIQPDDLHWLHPESLLEKVHPALNFWHDTRYTAHVHAADKVSFNILDIARNTMASLPFVERTSQALQLSLWQELMIRYLDQSNVEQAIAGDLATEPVFIEIDDV